MKTMQRNQKMAKMYGENRKKSIQPNQSVPVQSMSKLLPPEHGTTSQKKAGPKARDIKLKMGGGPSNTTKFGGTLAIKTPDDKNSDRYYVEKQFVQAMNSKLKIRFYLLSVIVRLRLTQSGYIQG